MVDPSRCLNGAACAIRPVWFVLRQRIDEVLDGIRLSDLLGTEAEVREAVGLSERPVAV
jgi:DNA-binding IscR family transcriptional regulator